MSQELVISSNPIETTVAVLEDDRLVEICVEHHAQRAISGSIYKGRVVRVLAGMESAFVDIGLKRDAFLYVTDVLDPNDQGDEDLDTDPIRADPSQALTSPSEPQDEGASQDEPAGSGNGEATEREQAESAQTEDVADGAAKRTSRRRSRRRRRSGRAEQSSTADGAVSSDAELEPSGEPAAESASPASDGSEPQVSVVLPGESLAKYAGEATPAETASQSEPTSGADAREAGAAEAASDGQVPDEAGTGGSGPNQDSAPPKDSATVSAPSLLAELNWNIFRWGKKAKDSEAGRSQPEPESKAASGDGGRPSGDPSERMVPGPPVQRGRERPKQRTGRRSSTSRRSQEGRPKGGPRSGGAPPRNGSPAREKPVAPQASIKDLLKNGQELIVQANKEPVGAKGARITAHVSLPGRFMVYMTTAAHNGVAKKIQPESERTRLRKIVDKHSSGKPGGFVLRSATRGVSEEELKADMDFLYKLWDELQAKAAKRRAPAKLHSDLDIVERMLRDQLGEGFKTIWVDSEDEYERILRFVERFNPELVQRVKLYTRAQPIFDSFGITKDLERALKAKVWLKSGGYLVINQTEALVAIDVNTGRYVGKSDRLEDTVLKTNLEAAEEVVRQLRLRDLGGIIAVDFIDMEDRKNRQQVHQLLQDALKRTRSPSRLLPFNDFGMVVITRKTVRQSLERAMCRPCPACSGSGLVKSPATVLSEVFTAADRIGAGNRGKDGELAKELTLRVHPDIAKSLKHRSTRHIETLEESVGAHVLVRGDATMHPDAFTLD